METQGAIGEKSLKINQKYINELKTSQARIFKFLCLFSIEKSTYHKNAFLKILFMYRDIDKNLICKFLFSMFFDNFSVSFQYF